MIDKIVSSLITSLIVVVIFLSSIISITMLVEAFRTSPVEECKVDSINTVIDSINIEIINIDSLRNENLKKAVNLNDSDTVELFWWLLAK